MRAAQSQATNLQGTDASTAANQNAQAQGVYTPLNSFLQNELAHPQGYSQQAMTAMLGANMAGTGGATSAITGQAALQQARTRNASGFAGALDAAQRIRGQQNAQGSEQISANNANLQNEQQQNAAQGLQGLYGTDSSNALKALGLQDSAINTEVNAGQTGWLQNATGVLKALQGAGMKSAGGGGFSL